MLDNFVDVAFTSVSTLFMYTLPTHGEFYGHDQHNVYAGLAVGLIALVPIILKSVGVIPQAEMETLSQSAQKKQ